MPESKNSKVGKQIMYENEKAGKQFATMFAKEEGKIVTAGLQERWRITVRKLPKHLKVSKKAT